MTVAIIVPLRLTDEHREAAWDHVRRHYETEHPDWPIITGKTRGHWSKGRAVQSAVDRTDASVLVIADSDSWTEPKVLTDATGRVGAVGWVTPHRQVRRYDEATTTAILTGAKHRARLIRNAYLGVRGGGITVISRSAYDLVGGIDPRFLGWGGEDYAFGFALKTLVGPGLRLNGTLWHLWHPASDDQWPNGAKHLKRRYSLACGKPKTMRALVEEHRAASRTEPDDLRHLESTGQPH